jgi:hypothetical protein
MRSLSEPGQIVIRCVEMNEEARRILRENLRGFAPFTSVIPLPDRAAAELSSFAPFLSSLERKGRLTRYECRNFTCQLPEVLA